jgi:hypothetical protein
MKVIHSHIYRAKEPTRFAYLLIALSVGLLSPACAPLPTKETAIVHLEGTATFPFVLLDFGSVELRLVELDGSKNQFRSTVFTPGRHSITVDALQGPTGMFGVAPFWKCRGQLEFDAEAGKAYIIKYKEEKESKELQFLDKTTGAVLFHAPCIPRSVFKYD